MGRPCAEWSSGKRKPKSDEWAAESKREKRKKLEVSKSWAKAVPININWKIDVLKWKKRNKREENASWWKKKQKRKTT